MSDRWNVDTTVNKDLYLASDVSDFDDAIHSLSIGAFDINIIRIYGYECDELIDFITELVHEIERLQGEVIARDSAIDSAIRYQHDMDWQKELRPFYDKYNDNWPFYRGYNDNH
jgi:hypothetical protein